VLSFAVVAGLVTIIPGLDTAMVLRSAITDGRRQGFATALGINAGCLVWGAAAAVGVSALLTASTAGYTTLRITGAIYMIWCGTRLLCRAIRGRTGDEGLREPLPADAGLARSWSRGLMTNLLNPKIGAFYLAVMPQFIPAHAPHLAVGLLLALVHDLEGILWFSVIILGTHRLRATLARRSTRRAVDGLTGTALVGFGIRLGLASR
jgi:threonine/homoserine/homoserine lactone efflux protein